MSISSNAIREEYRIFFGLFVQKYGRIARGCRLSCISGIAKVIRPLTAGTIRLALVAETSRRRGIDLMPAVGFDAMRTLSKTIVALGLVALMAGPALAQQGRGGGGRGGFGGGGLGMLLGNASVQQELKLDAAQIEKSKELNTKLREKVTAATQGLEGQERFTKMREMSKELNTEANTAAKDFLKPEQLKRLHQIQHQVQGAQAFADEHVQTRLKLTDAQKSDIASIVEASNTEMRSLGQGFQSDPEGTRAKLAEHRKETLSKIDSKLTDEQKTTYKEMLGAPFEIKFEPRPGGGGGR